MLIEGAKYYTIETTNDHFSMKICGQNARTIRDLRCKGVTIYSNIFTNYWSIQFK